MLRVSRKCLKASVFQYLAVIWYVFLFNFALTGAFPCFNASILTTFSLLTKRQALCGAPHRPFLMRRFELCRYGGVRNGSDADVIYYLNRTRLPVTVTKS